MESRVIGLDQEDFFYQDAAAPVIKDILSFISKLKKPGQKTFQYVWDYPIDPDVWFDLWEDVGYALYEIEVKVRTDQFDEGHPGWNIDGEAGFTESSEARIDIDIQLSPEKLGDSEVLEKLRIELYNVVPHEMHHLTQKDQPFQRVSCPLTNSSSKSAFHYFTSSCEVPAFVVGFRGESYATGRPVKELMSIYLDNQVKARKMTRKEAEETQRAWLSHSSWGKDAMNESIIREYVRGLLIEAASGDPDMTQYVDDLEDAIFSFLFTRSTFDELQKLSAGVEATLVLPTSIFDEFKNINEVHLGIAVTDDGSANVEAAYVCVIEDRSKSNLVLTLDIPRSYPTIEGFQDWLSAELADALSHEIQHSCDDTETLSSDDCGDPTTRWDSIKNIEKYYGCDAEVRGHSAGILGRARRTGQDPSELLSVDMSTIRDRAAAKGFVAKDIEAMIDRIRVKWSSRLGIK
tara:strand:- start:13404 stop:14786 length:1383 start_codon:yes stop_codon:yes gene_type:complete